MSEQKKSWQTGLEYAALSDIGMRRSNNQDSFAISLARDEAGFQGRGHLFLVADGMGAHAAGELASKIAAERVPHLYRKYREGSAPDALNKAIRDANAEMNRRGLANSDFHNMGTTCCTLAILPQGAVVTNLGDSRIYRLRGGKLEQLTFDHSLVWEMRAAGQLPPDGEIKIRGLKNVITRSMGPSLDIDIDFEGPYETRKGDVFLLCSDGLTGPVPDTDLAPILAHLAPENAAQLLLDLANLRGGPDNITAIVVRVAGPEAITQHAASSERLIYGGRVSSRTVHPMLYVVLGVCFVVALGMYFSIGWLPSLIASLGGLLSLAAIFWQIYGGAGKSFTPQYRMGKGPYSQTPSKISPDLLSHLTNTVKQLRAAAADDEKWDINWALFAALEKKAAAVATPEETLRAQGAMISFLMKELRAQREQNNNDSLIDLL